MSQNMFAINIAAVIFFFNFCDEKNVPAFMRVCVLAVEG